MSLKNRFSRVFKGTTRSPENVENDWIHIGEAEELHALGALLRELLFRHRIWNGNEMGPEILKEHRESLDRKPEFADLLSDLDLLMNIDPAERGTFETLDSLKSLACAKFHTRHVEPFRLEAVASETELLPFIDHLGVETTEEVITALEFHLI